MSSPVILHNTNEPLLNWFVTCNEKWILYDNQQWWAQWLDQEEAPNHLPKPNLHQKKGHSHCLVVCCPSNRLQLSEPRQNHYIWEVRSGNQWDALKTVSRMGPVLLHDNINRMSHNQCFKNWTTKFWLIHRIHLTTCQPTATSSTISTTFCRGKYFHNHQEAENAFQEFLEFWSTDFYATRINYFLLAKICWL